MAYKLVAIDLDGTLLDPDLQISPRNVAVIRDAIAANIIVTLSTGRMFAAALPFARLLQLDVPLITCNGAAVICAETKKIYYEVPLPSDLVLSIITEAQRRKMTVSIYTVDDIFVAETGDNVNIHARIDNAEVKPADLAEVAAERKIIKILLTSPNLYADTEQMHSLYGARTTFYFSLPWFTEIVAQGVNKGAALKTLGNVFGVSSAEMIAIGDNYNDLPMLEYAGLGVAMGNASVELKEQADFVTRRHDDDGVADVIEKFILKQRR